jgi:hypothetical protein
LFKLLTKQHEPAKKRDIFDIEGTNRTITNRRRTEKSAAQSEREFKSTFGNFPYFRAATCPYLVRTIRILRTMFVCIFKSQYEHRTVPTVQEEYRFLAFKYTLQTRNKFRNFY